jgi:hypothetical protein
MTDESYIVKDWKGNACGLMEVLSLHFPGEAEESHDKAQAEYSVCLPR